MKIRFYGTRGSVPRANRDYMEYGGNTSCVYVDCGVDLIIDAGSGIVALGTELRNTDRDIHILLSHVHFDHIQGLYGFAPFFQENRKIHIYGECRDGMSIEEQLRSLIRPPFWPVGFDDFKANIAFHDVETEKDFIIKIKQESDNSKEHEYDIKKEHGLNNNRQDLADKNDIRVITHRSVHPNQCQMFKVEHSGSKIVYALDYEYLPTQLDDLAQFGHKADLMIFDCAYLPGQVIKGFGHSSWDSAILVAKEASVKEVVMSHFSYEYTDDVLFAEEKKMMETSEIGLFAREGMEFEV